MEANLVEMLIEHASNCNVYLKCPAWYIASQCLKINLCSYTCCYVVAHMYIHIVVCAFVRDLQFCVVDIPIEQGRTSTRIQVKNR